MNSGSIQPEKQKNACFCCDAEGYNVKKCKRCGVGRYCNKECQLKDHDRHKILCKIVCRFYGARSKISSQQTHRLFYEQGYKGISYFLGSIPDRTRYNILGGPRMLVMLEILELVEDPVIWKVKVRDIENKTAEIIFNTFKYCPKLDVQAYYKDSLTLARVLKPGNFVLLLGIVWRFYEQKTADLTVEDLSFAEFI